MDLPRLEEQLSHRFGWVVTLFLVAGTAFILGRQYQPRIETTSGDEVVSASQPAGIIQDIQQSLSSGTDTDVVTSSDPIAESTGIVHLNSATLAELDKLPGIGPTKARAIIDYRTANGPFVRVDDLVNVKGIGPATLEKLRSQITL